MLTKRLTIDSVNLNDQCEMDALDDQMITAGIERVRAEGDELRRRGLLDEHGNLLAKVLADVKQDTRRFPMVHWVRKRGDFSTANPG